MLATDRDALICDLAETYHVLNYRELNPTLLATLCVGLRDSSRIKMKMNKSRLTFEQVLLVSILDHIRILLSSGAERPELLLNMFLNQEKELDNESFDSSDEFKKKWNEIIERGMDGN